MVLRQSDKETAATVKLSSEVAVTVTAVMERVIASPALRESLMEMEVNDNQRKFSHAVLDVADLVETSEGVLAPWTMTRTSQPVVAILTGSKR